MPHRNRTALELSAGGQKRDNRVALVEGRGIAMGPRGGAPLVTRGFWLP